MKAVLLTLGILAQKIILLFQIELLWGYVGCGKKVTKMPKAILRIMSIMYSDYTMLLTLIMV